MTDNAVSIKIGPFFSATANGDLAVLTVGVLILFLVTILALIFVFQKKAAAKTNKGRAIKAIPMLIWYGIRAASFKFGSRDNLRP